jgi:hypothetical protein
MQGAHNELKLPGRFGPGSPTEGVLRRECAVKHSQAMSYLQGESMGIKSCLNSAGRAEKQSQAEPLLQVSDVLANSTLRKSKFMGRAGEAAEPSGGLKGPQCL